MALIMIVDDSPTEVHVLKTALEKHGFDTVSAADGSECLSLAREVRPDLIFMDVVMPRVNGYQATRTLTRDPQTKSIPVVMITTKDQETDRIWGMRQGAVDYLVKPVTRSRARRQGTRSARAGVERLNLQALAEQPFELLVELERRARAAIAAREGAPATSDEWVGIGFRLGAERFVTSRADVREVLPIPEQVTRVPGAKPWLRGIANLRGQLLTVVDLKSFLGAGTPAADRQARVLVVASREVPNGADRRRGARLPPLRLLPTIVTRLRPSVIRCEHYLEGSYRRGPELWPRFSLLKLLEDPLFLTAGETVRAMTP